MAAPTSYCEYAENLPLDNLHRIYHDTGYGFPIDNDNELFERLVLEINQAGLSWSTILNKRIILKLLLIILISILLLLIKNQILKGY